MLVRWIVLVQVLLVGCGMPPSPPQKPEIPANLPPEPLEVTGDPASALDQKMKQMKRGTR
ncbi:MAG: hypothetical protein SNJ75_18280 [Gemmataceae bacterium]